MRKFIVAAAALALLGSGTAIAESNPKKDLKEFREYYMKKFPGIPLNEFGNGVYAIDEASRETWESIEEFPPYELDIEKGERLFNIPFANGKTYASCFKNGGKKIRQNYPYFDKKRKEVITLEMAINECRTSNGEKPLRWGKGDIAAISAYMAYTSRGKKIKIKIPNKDALAWYERGKEHFYAKRGQLNFSCANCHKDSAGGRVRADILSPALGHPSHFPVYRAKWGGLGTLHRRYGGCNKQVRAKPFKPQSEEYRALEYFHTYMSNGIKVNGPGSRK